MTGELRGGEGRGGPGTDLRLSADGGSLAVARGDGTVTVVDITTGKRRWSVAAHVGGARTVAISPDGMRIASGGADRRVCVWDAMSGALKAEVGAQRAELKRVAWSPDSRTIAWSAESPESRVMLWDGSAGSEPVALVGHTGVIWSVEFSPDGRELATGGTDRELRLWSVDRRETARKLEAPNGTVRSLHYAADGTLMSAGWFSVDLWGVPGGRRTRSMSIPEASECSAISADGSRIAVGYIDGVVQVWDTGPGAGMVRMKEEQEGRTCAMLSPDGRVLATGDGRGVLRLWDAWSGARLAEARVAQSRIRTLQFSPDGRRLASGSDDDEALLWDLATGDRSPVAGSYRSLSGGSLAFSPGGRWLAVPRSDASISLLDMEGKGEERRLGPIGTEIVSAMFDPKGEFLAVIARDDVVRLCPVGGGEPVILPQVSPWATCISADGRWLAAGGWPREIGVWDLSNRTLARTLRGHRGLITALKFMPGEPGVLASAAADGTVRLWDIQTGLTLATLDAFEGWEALSVSFSPDGRRLASSGSNGEAVVWDLLYFDRHIAGNVGHQLRALGADVSDPTPLQAWAAAVQAREDVVGPVRGVAPETIASWGRRAPP